MSTRVPPVVTPEVQALCAKTGSAHEVRWVKWSKRLGAKPNSCIPNVLACVRRKGGQLQLGWRLLEWPGVLVEAELHAVWQQPNGEWIDVTPHPFKSARILFLPHPEFEFDLAGTERANNVRLALSDDPRVARFIELCDEMWRVEEANSVERVIRFSPEEGSRWRALQRERIALQESLTGVKVPIGPATRFSPLRPKSA